VSKRQKLKAAVITIATTEVVYDRRATDLTLNAVVAPLEIIDPFGAKVVVLASLLGDVLRDLRVRYLIDEAQFTAGRQWQRHWEACELGIKGMDTTKEPVDGGGVSADIVTECSRRARLRIVHCAKVLGRERDSLVVDILGRGMLIKTAASARGIHTERGRQKVGQSFRECLEILAREFNYA
jgi:hypothetical protein